MLQKYKTKQRDEILGVFRDNPEKCMSAREVAAMVDAGEATVLRALSALTEEGLLRRFSADAKGSAQYRLNTCADEHIHLKCLGCGRLIHMDCGFTENIREHFMKDHDFMLDSSRTVIYGVCGDCRRARETAENGYD